MKCNKCGYDDSGSGDMAHVCQRPSFRYGEHPTSFGLFNPKQEPVAFPRQAGDSTWTVDTAFIWRVKHTIDPDTPHDFIPSEEQIETVLLALEKIPSGIYTTPPQRKPLSDEDVERIVREARVGEHGIGYTIARATEAAHGIKE